MEGLLGGPRSALGGLLGGPLRSSWSRTPETNCRGAFESRWGAAGEPGAASGDRWGIIGELSWRALRCPGDLLGHPWIFLCQGLQEVRAGGCTSEAQTTNYFAFAMRSRNEPLRNPGERRPLESCRGVWNRHWGAFLESLGLPWAAFLEGPCVLLGQELQKGTAEEPWRAFLEGLGLP